MPRPEPPKIGQYFIENGLIDEFQLKSALGYQARWGKKLGQCLIELGFISESKLAKALSQVHRLQTIDLDRAQLSAEVLNQLPRKVVLQYNVVPVQLRTEGHKKKLLLATADPSDIRAVDEIGFLTGHAIGLLIATYSAIERAIRRHYLGEAIPLPQENREISLVREREEPRHDVINRGEIKSFPPNGGKGRKKAKKPSRFETGAFDLGEIERAREPAAGRADESFWEADTRVRKDSPDRQENTEKKTVTQTVYKADLFVAADGPGAAPGSPFTLLLALLQERNLLSLEERHLIEQAQAGPSGQALHLLLERLQSKGLLTAEECRRIRGSRS
jgi:hypothetical protein